MHKWLASKKPVKDIYEFDSDSSFDTDTDICSNSSTDTEDNSDSFLVNVAVELSKCTCKGPPHARHCPCNLHNVDKDLDSRSDEAGSKFDNVSESKSDEPLPHARSDEAGSKFDNVSESKSDESDGVEITHTSVYVPNDTDSVLGDPEPTEEWKARAVAYITKLCKQPVTLRNSRINKIDSTNIRPYVRDKIVGDGNCLFRAISKAVTGNEANHFAVRTIICDFMSLDNNTEAFGTLVYTNTHDNSDPSIIIENYIKSKKLRNNKIWGSDVEIIVAATMLQVTFFMSCIYGSGRSLVQYKPLFTNNTCMEPCGKRPCIYLYHDNTPKHEHYDLVHLPDYLR